MTEHEIDKFLVVLIAIGLDKRPAISDYWSTEAESYTPWSTDYTGTVNLNRKGFPAEIKDLKLEHRQMKWFAKEDEAILCVAFEDKKAKKNFVISSTDATVATIQKKDVVKPLVIDNYNHKMNGRNLMDQRIAYY
ncbi:PiggyBac transposable element-derived protein 4 [Plakobranchus ocellatus]|uniref:PiggyBac transposable element-derived protein 4 n=1 Tax=Plakobranchus ocellatus TaxID=259542 RepID=A0AAV3YJB6_9GAST|nr:PiggyBac transposable element-derived protein 4 [Plakobranchus ocellatus]